MKSYPLGSTVLLSAVFKDLTTEPPSLVTPGSVALATLDPNRIVTSVETDNPSDGKYQGSITPMTSGIWRYKFTGVGAATAVAEGTFEVLPSAFGTTAYALNLVPPSTGLSVVPAELVEAA